MKKLTAEYQYDAAPATVFATMTDDSALVAKYEALGARNIEVLHCGPVGDGFRVTVKRTVSVDVPGFARRVLSPSNTVTHTDEWGPAANGVREGRWTVDVSGVPTTMGGTMTLQPNGTGTSYRLAGEVKVSVPLLGGRLEDFAVSNAKRDLDREHEFLTRRLRG